ncbi:MAG: rod shape-determining protein MreC [Treponema sp.]|jgi:rod shape-determining protein MreC|nr:rod shape-determining protein MreC [Treponema sp.]
MTEGGSSRRKRGINANAYVFVGLSLLSFLVLLFSARSFVVDFSDMGLSMYSGLRGSIHSFSSFISRTVFSIRELTALREQYDELTERMVRYEQLEQNAAEIRRENSRLREQLGFSQTLMYRHFAAEIIGRDPDNLFSAYVINKGRRNGITTNMPVITYRGGTRTLVGKIVQSAQVESMVTPLYDAGSFVSCRLGESRIEGIVEGQGRPESPLLMRFVRRRNNEEISVGEPVVTSGLGGVYPPGIIVGRVSKILYNDTDTSIEIEVESTTDFSLLEYVFVIDVQSIPERNGPSASAENPVMEASNEEAGSVDG